MDADNILAITLDIISLEPGSKGNQGFPYDPILL